MNRIHRVLIALLLPLTLLAQPQVEWVWEDSAQSHGLNSIATALDNGFLLTTSEYVIRISQDGVEEWRTRAVAYNTCVLGDSGYVLRKSDHLLLMTEHGVVTDTIWAPPNDEENTFWFGEALRVGPRVFVVRAREWQDLDRWGDVRNSDLVVSTSQITVNGEMESGQSLGDFSYADNIGNVDAIERQPNRIVFLVNITGDTYRLRYPGDSLGNGWWQTTPHRTGPPYRYTWKNPQLIPFRNNTMIVAAVEIESGDEYRDIISIEKFDVQGESIWAHDLISSSSKDFTTLAARQNADGGELIVRSFEYGVSDSLLIVGFDSLGELMGTQQWAIETIWHQVKAIFDNQGRALVANVVGTDSTQHVRLTALQAQVFPARPALPTTFALHPNFPNPFNPSTEISFDMPYGAPATLKVYDILGREVATLADGMLEAGTYRATFDGTGLASGVYIYRLESNNFSQSRKMVLMK